MARRGSGGEMFFNKVSRNFVWALVGVRVVEAAGIERSE